PIPNLPEEIHVSSFCDTTLTIPDRYTSIQWSNGSTEPYTTVSQPGPVSVSVVTIFGDTLQYTTNIIYPGNVIDDFALCFNSDTLWDTGLDDFQVVWQDGSEGPEYTITESGIYFPVVTDVSGCTFAYDTVIVTDDFFSQTLAINYEEPFCQGNALEINQNPEDIVSFNWNTGSSESAIIPDEEGLYWVEVNNENGCTGTDTVTVQFAGIAPEVQYTASQFCAGTEIIFTDETDPGDDSQVVSTI